MAARRADIPRTYECNIKKRKVGSHLTSHAVSSIVLSAVPGLTVVFGMGTGISPERITTNKIRFSSFFKVLSL